MKVAEVSHSATFYVGPNTTSFMKKNIRLRMPKWQQLKAGTWAKELLMTFIGTTLSIILTFGTAQYFDQKQQRADGRQTAMMVIHDMEMSANRFERYAKNEAEMVKLTQYAIIHIDQLDSIPLDTLQQVVSYLLRPDHEAYQYDDSNEKLFLSSQDVWKNINNATFIDVVQQFFYQRRAIYYRLNSSRMYREPISSDDVYQFRLNNNQSFNFDFVGFLAERLKRPEVICYLNTSSQRQQEFNTYLTSLKEQAERCKFMMDISDEELKSFIARRQFTGHRIKAHQLVGVWTTSDDLDRTESVEFRKDHSLLISNVLHITTPYFVGRIEATQSQTGTWELKGDSLIFMIDPEFEYAIDQSGITCSPGKEQELNELLTLWENSCKEAQQQAVGQPPIRNGCVASIDGLGTKIETRDINAESGKEEYSYLVKQE